MGTVENPMPANVKAEIALWGNEQAITVIMVEGLFLVNKAPQRADLRVIFRDIDRYLQL